MEWFDTTVKIVSFLVSSGFFAFLVKIWKDRKAERNGDMCLLRKGMLDTYYKYKDAKVIPEYEAKNFMLMYDAYKARGGNSFIDEVHDHVVTWELEI